MEISQEQLQLWEQSEKVLAGTGHRPEKLNKEYELVGPCATNIRKELAKLFEILRPSKVISGMALGFDQLLALFSIEKGIPVLAAVPCDNQEKVWPKKSQERYTQILSSKLVSTYVVCPEAYHPGTMQVRNEWMCDHSNGLVAAWDGTSDGTANCIRYARKNSMSIFYINLDLQKTKDPQNRLFE